MGFQDDLPQDDTLTPPTSETGGIPFGMQAGAKAGGDVVDRDRAAHPEHGEALVDAGPGDTEDTGDKRLARDE